MDYAKLVMDLSDIPAPSGYEDAVRQRIGDIIGPLMDELKTDPLGNLIGVKRCGIPKARSLMLCAHMDEIGFVVTGHEKGFLRFAALGGIDPRLLPASELLLLTPEPIPAVVDVMPPHALTQAETEKAQPIDELFLDAGLSEEEAPNLVPLGTAAVYASSACLMGQGSVCGKALDNRSCAAVMIRVLEELSGRTLDFDLYCLFSVQEELGTRGAIAGAFGIAPDYAIVLDTTFGRQYDVEKHKSLKMGGGPAIGLGPNLNRRLTEALSEKAKTMDLPFQLEVLPGDTGTDAWPIQVSRSGVAAALVSLPLRYMHTPAELIRVSDGEAIVKLLSAFLMDAGEVL